MTTQAFAHGDAPAVLRSYLAGLTLSTAGSSATFSVAAGQAADSTNAAYMTLASAISKTTSAWAAGTGNGALDTGAIANSTWYHAYLIKNPTTAAVDVLISLSPTAPTLPSGFTLFRRIGAMKTNGSSQWYKFYQYGDQFVWDIPLLDVNSAIANTALTARALNVPSGIAVDAEFIATLNTTATVGIVFFTRDQTGTTAGVNDLVAYNGVVVSGNFKRRTDTSQQINSICTATTGTLLMSTTSWIDRRGRDN